MHRDDILLLYFQTVVYGMLFAFGLLILKKYKIISDNNKENLFSTGISWGLTGMGVLGLGVSNTSFSQSSFYTSHYLGDNDIYLEPGYCHLLKQRFCRYLPFDKPFMTRAQNLLLA